MKIIKTKKNIQIQIDDEDFEYLNQYTWCIDGSGYPCTTTIDVDGIYRQKRIHYLLMQSLFIDHKDTNRLNNQKENLRKANRSQNRANSKLSCNNKTGYRGVSFSRHMLKYGAGIKINGKSINLGYFPTKEEAALRYNQAAIHHFGEFAKLNNICQK